MKLKVAALAAALLVGAAPAGLAAETTRYQLLLPNGAKAGEQVVERGDDGLTKVRFIQKDNGRGPEIEERIRYAPDGSIAEYHATGRSEMGAPVNERFSLKNGKAEWRSEHDKGSKDLAGPALYIPMQGSYQTESDKIAALAGKDGASLALLPSGSLTQKKLAELEVRATGTGQRQTVQLLMHKGLGMEPRLLWATTGPAPRLFALLEPGSMTMIEDGWLESVPEMEVRQKVAADALLAEMASLRHPLPGLTVLRNARIFNSGNATLDKSLSDILILRGRISAVRPAGQPVRGADNEIDAAGRVVLPGLFDMHGHLDRDSGPLHLAAGVTTVRDLGNDNAQLQQMMDETAAGKLLAPQVVPTGFLEGKSPYSANFGFVISDWDGAKNAVDWYADRAYPQLKIYNSFPPTLLKRTVAYAHSRGMRVSGHVPAGLRAAQAVEAGYDEIQHINQIMLNFLVTPKTETRTIERFTLPAEKVAGLDLDSKPVKDFVALLKAKKVAIDPTLATFSFIAHRSGEVNPPYAPVAGHLPPDVARDLLSEGLDVENAEAAKRHRLSYGKMVEFVGRMYRAGVPLLAGTDALAGFTLHSELELYTKAGLTPAQALQVATKNGARYSGVSHDRGSIAPGKLADLVLVDGDPTTRIADLRKVALVLTQGHALYPAELHRAMSIKPFVDGAPAVRRLAQAGK